MTHQSFQQWQRSPQQGAIPRPADIEDPLLDAFRSLQSSREYLEDAGLSARYSQLSGAISDALTACSEAICRLKDSPDF